MIVIGLDPGYEQSAMVAWNGTNICWSRFEPNDDVLQHMRPPYALSRSEDLLVIEKIESFGMAVGVTTLDTVLWSGRFAQAYGFDRVRFVTRRAIKLHLCGHARATDANIRQALIDRFGPSTEKAIGKKRTPGPLYGITAHKLSALAVALTWADQHPAEVTVSPVRREMVGEF